ncbi:MAG: response regulator [Rubrivirga sp.]
MSSEIHDGPLQELARLARSSPPDIQKPLRDVGDELRALASGLRPSALDRFGLEPALEDLADRWARASPPLVVRVNIDPGGRLPEDVELAAYRITQEALANAHTHGLARTAWVFLRRERGDVDLLVRDDGTGISGQRPLLNLASSLPEGTMAWPVCASGQALWEDRYRSVPDPAVSVLTFVSEFRSARDPKRCPSRERFHLCRCTNVIRVLLVDDHPSLRAGVRRSLDTHSLIDVVAEAGDGTEALRLARELEPDVVVLDVDLPGVSGAEVARALAGSAIRVLGFSAHSSRGFVRGMLTAGAAGYLTKDMPEEELTAAVLAVARRSDHESGMSLARTTSSGVSVVEAT